MKFDTNSLRALAGVILLILAIALMGFHDENDALNYICLALAGFLVGGSLFSKDNVPPSNGTNNSNSD